MQLSLTPWCNSLILCCITKFALANCPPYPAPEHGTVSSFSSTPVGQSVVISCGIGYTISAASQLGRPTPACVQYPPVGSSQTGAYNRTAEERMGYQRGSTCQPISCGPFPATQNSVVMPEGDVVYGSYATIVCDAGHTHFGIPGSTKTPRCQSDGSFEIGQGCSRILLQCLSSVATLDEKIMTGQSTYQNETCHPDTQYCATAVKGSTIWRGCGPPVVKIGTQVVAHSDWLAQVKEADKTLGRESSSWLSSHMLCQDGQINGAVEIPPNSFGGGVWRYTCCCSPFCNAGFKCIYGAIGTSVEEETSDTSYHMECPTSKRPYWGGSGSSGCYSLVASGAGTGWRVIDQEKYTKSTKVHARFPCQPHHAPSA